MSEGVLPPPPTEVPTAAPVNPEPVKAHVPAAEKHGFMSKLKGLLGNNKPLTAETTAGYNAKGNYEVATMGQKLDALSEKLNAPKASETATTQNAEVSQSATAVPDKGPIADNEARKADMAKLAAEAKVADDAALQATREGLNTMTDTTVDDKFKQMLEPGGALHEITKPDVHTDESHSNIGKVVKGATGVGLASVGILSGAGVAGAAEAPQHTEPAPIVSESGTTVTNLDMNNPTVTVDADGSMKLGTVDTAEKGSSGSFSSDTPGGEFKPQSELTPPPAGAVEISDADAKAAVEQAGGSKAVGETVTNEGGATNPVEANNVTADASAETATTPEKTTSQDVRNLFDNPDASPYTVQHANGEEEIYGKKVEGGDKILSESTLNAEGKKMLQEFMEKNNLTDPVAALKQMGVKDLAYGMPMPEDGDIENFREDVKQTLVAEGAVTAYDAETGKISFETQMPKSIAEEKAKAILGRDLTDAEKANGIVALCQNAERVMLGEGVPTPQEIAGDSGVVFYKFENADGSITQARIANTRATCDMDVDAPPVVETPATPVVETPVTPAPPVVETPITPVEETPAPPIRPPAPELPATGVESGDIAAAGLTLAAVGGGALGAAELIKRRGKAGETTVAGDEAGAGPEPKAGENIRDLLRADILNLQSGKPNIEVTTEKRSVPDGRVTRSESVNRVKVEDKVNTPEVRAAFEDALSRVGRDLARESGDRGGAAENELANHKVEESNVVDLDSRREAPAEEAAAQTELDAQIAALEDEVASIESKISGMRGVLKGIREARLQAKKATVETQLTAKQSARDSATLTELPPLPAATEQKAA